jgi:hypothetical protein
MRIVRLVSIRTPTLEVARNYIHCHIFLTYITPGANLELSSRMTASDHSPTFYTNVLLKHCDEWGRRPPRTDGAGLL